VSEAAVLLIMYAISINCPYNTGLMTSNLATHTCCQDFLNHSRQKEGTFPGSSILTKTTKNSI